VASLLLTTKPSSSSALSLRLVNITCDADADAYVHKPPQIIDQRHSFTTSLADPADYITNKQASSDDTTIV
jgi:hypothetical protein